MNKLGCVDQQRSGKDCIMRSQPCKGIIEPHMAHNEYCCIDVRLYSYANLKPCIEGKVGTCKLVFTDIQDECIHIVFCSQTKTAWGCKKERCHVK